MKVLVTGGSGYIGSHTIVDLLNNGFDVVSIDNHSRSRPEVIDDIKNLTSKGFHHYNIDLCDKEKVREVFKQEKDIEAIIHFAALKSVPESVSFPELYYRNNLISLINLTDLIKEFNILHFVFSSSCSVYGNPDLLPVTEDTPLKKAESPYARTKQMGEDILKDISASSTSNFIILRYFNPVGAHPSTKIGEYTVGTEVSNLIPRITGFASGKYPSFTVFGSDYETRDGSCIRDYIHVCDIASAHTKALQYCISNQLTSTYEIFNLGTGNGVSVLEMVSSFEKVSGLKLNITLGPRREGDVVQVFANNEKAKNLLKWIPEKSLDEMTLSSWKWEMKINKNNC